MDSQDASALHPHFLFHHHAHPHHHSQPPPMSHPAVLLGPHSQTQPHLPNNSYQLPNSSSSVNPASTAPTNNPFLQQQNPRFPFNTMAAAAPSGPKPPDHMQADGSNSGGGGVAGAFSVEPARKRRGRPRKYSPDNSIGLGLSPAPVSQISSAAAHNDSGGGGGTPSSDTPAKRNRGRPPGSVKRQLNALGIPGVGFTPHVITVNAGEDVASKIMAFSQQGPRTVCILSANGSICSVTLRQPATSGGTVTYEGRFEIISLSGSLQQSENEDNHSGGGGGLSVSLAGSEGRVLGGGVAGILKAASPVQIVVGSFIADGKKSKSQTSPGTTTNMFNFGTGPSSSSESGENDESPLNRGAVGGYNSGQAPIQNMYSSMGWPNMNMLPQ